MKNTYPNSRKKIFEFGGKKIEVRRNGDLFWDKGKMKLFNKENGYVYVTIARKNFYVHRIVAICHIQNPQNKKCVNHKNGIKTDNRAENLEWCTHSENLKHSFSKLGRRFITQRRDIIGFKHAQSKPVRQINARTGEIIEIHGSISQAALKINGLNCGIDHVLKRRNKSYYGYKWEYAKINKDGKYI